MSNFLIVNPGSTAVKYTIFSADGTEISRQKFGTREQRAERKFLMTLPPIQKIGIRIVHGRGLVGPKKITRSVRKIIAAAEIFAPIHNRIALDTLKKLDAALPRVPAWAVFDSDFHQHIPVALRTLPIPPAVAKKFGLRRYGFHGTAVESAWQSLGRPRGKIIFCHIGGGSSVTAVKNGRSQWNSMGLTPLSGAMGITRSGSVDPDIFHVLSTAHKKFSPDVVSDLLSHRSGFLGLAGSIDTRKIFDRAAAGSSREQLAVEIFCHSVLREIFTAFAVLQGADLLVFSGGIGENNAFFRDQILKKIRVLDLKKSNTRVAHVDEERVILEKIRTC